jgi:hypothetical protein
MKKNSSLIERLMDITEQEEPKILQELKEENLVTFYRLSLLGLFDSMENFAKSAKTLLSKGSVLTPTPAIKILLNATISLCASAEKILDKIETKENEEILKEQKDLLVNVENQETSSLQQAKPEKPVSPTTTTQDPFNTILKAFKKPDSGNN